MGRRLIPDTNILIAYERGAIDRAVLDDDELAVASISIAEYRTGIELGGQPGTRGGAGRRARVDHLGHRRAPYTLVTAAHHARLLAHVRRSGSPRSAHDLIVAAHAAETGRLILTSDAKARFSDLPGITAIDA